MRVELKSSAKAEGFSPIPRRRTLKTITGFKPDYILEGTQKDQKKFIGNAVTPIIPKLWIEAIYNEINRAA